MQHIVEIHAKPNIGFVASDLYSKYCRIHTNNEHRVCDLDFLYEIVRNRADILRFVS